MIAAIIEIVFIGLGVWAINTYLPIPQTFKGIIMFLGILAVLMVLWAIFGGHQVIAVR